METFWMIPITAIVGGLAVGVVSIISRTRLRELEIKERIAMIERGMVPAPEKDPTGFDRAISQLDRFERYRSSASARHRRAGITLMGIGFGLMVLIGMTADGRDAVGVGGFLVVLGLAFFINALFEARQPPATPSTSTPPPPSNPTPPPQS